MSQFNISTGMMRYHNPMELGAPLRCFQENKETYVDKSKQSDSIHSFTEVQSSFTVPQQLMSYLPVPPGLVESIPCVPGVLCCACPNL